MDAKIVVFNDGSSYESERRELFSNGSTKARAHVIISTPERLVQHLIDRNGTINLKRLRYLIVDEADAMRFVREEWLGMLERAANCRFFQA
jgi:superfamily II DNA/RNA helicase